jgi:Meiotically up-regulated gene 113
MALTRRQKIDRAWREWWDERAAIMEIDGGLSRDKAEEKATLCLLEWAETHKPLDYSREGKVYVIHEDGTPLYKIGRSWSPLNRRKELQTGSAGTLHLLREMYHYDCMTLEKELHKRYKKYRKNGEWFALPEPVLHALLAENFDCNRGKENRLSEEAP